jgi:cellobiose phosphorylase
MFRVAVESVFGFSVERGQTLVVKPSISASWPRCRLIYRLPGETTRYEITIENPSATEFGVTSATIDERPAEVINESARIPLHHDGRVHSVSISL